MKKQLILAIAAMGFLFFSACNKDKKYSNELSGETWEASSLVIDGVAETVLPSLEFNDCKIYKETCSGIWESEGHSHGSGSADPEVSFAWQIRDKGKTLEISNQTEGEAAVQCWQLSGVYQLTRNSKTQFDLTSNSTQGYPGKQVVIKLTKSEDHDH
jgi:hypothetical protein